VRAIVDATRPRDHEYDEVHGGHIGVIVGGRAPDEVWQPIVDWLRPRSLEEPITAAAAAERSPPRPRARERRVESRAPRRR
jgi:hypothetical protein